MRKFLVVVAALAVFFTFTGEDEDPASGSATPGAPAQTEGDPDGEDRPDPSDDATADDEEAAEDAAEVEREKQRDRERKEKAEQRSESEPKPAPKPRTWLVTRVIDGDTIELGNGAGVRVVGIDTPERGECGYDAATASMSRLVLGKRVRLTMSDEDTDRYGRWLRYVNVGTMDAGLRQIKGGFAIARYDSRDGYGFHKREPIYIAADKANKNLACAAPAPAPATPATPKPAGSGCAPGYSPCLPPYPPDVDCGDVNGPIQVTGTDPHGLDADGDGVACE